MSEKIVNVNLEIDPEAITYGEYKRLLKSQKPGSGVSQDEAWEIVEKIVINKDALDDLPMVRVVPAILDALGEVMGGIGSEKAKN